MYNSVLVSVLVLGFVVFCSYWFFVLLNCINRISALEYYINDCFPDVEYDMDEVYKEYYESETTKESLASNYVNELIEPIDAGVEVITNDDEREITRRYRAF